MRIDLNADEIPSPIRMHFPCRAERKNEASLLEGMHNYGENLHFSTEARGNIILSRSSISGFLFRIFRRGVEGRNRSGNATPQNRKVVDIDLAILGS